MGKIFHTGLAIAFYFLGTALLFAQGNRCATIQPFCAGDKQYVFPNSHPGNSSEYFAETGPNYGCLGDQPFPAWYFMKVGESGNLIFDIVQSENADGSGNLYDVDFVVWGPFNVQDEICGGSALSANRIVDCSFEDFAIERMTIPNAQEDQIYVVLLTNYSQQPGYISLQQINASSGGSTDCSIVGSALGPDQQICGDIEVVLDATNEQATEYKWYILNETTGNYEQLPGESGPTLTVNETGNYQVTVYNEDLDSEASDDVFIEFFDLPEANEPSPVFGCLQGGNYVFDLFKTEEELIGQNSGTYLLNFYLSQADYETGNSIPNPSNFTAAGEQLIFATIIDEETGCESLPVDLELRILTDPDLNIDPVTYLCVNLNGVLISPVSLGEDLGEDYIYEWNPVNDPDGDGNQNGLFEINELPQQGEISLNLINRESGCTTTYTTRLKVTAPPREVVIEANGSDFDGGYTITATAVRGIGEETEYEYRLNNGSWQNDQIFTGIPGGTHRISARERNGCGNAVSLQFRLIGYQRFFTPNSDGYNDTWNVINDDNSSIRKVLIFDRYGKLLKDLNPSSRGWDGTFNGMEMPADDYWFRIEYMDPETGAMKEFKSHFTLKR